MNKEPLPEPLWSEAVECLREALDHETAEHIRELIAADPEGWVAADQTPESDRARILERYGFYMPTPFHFGAGMAIRNILRMKIKDEELPAVEYEDGIGYRNWDDWYPQVVEEAVR